MLTSSLPGTADGARPVRSLDQLYAQAAAVAPVLHRKCAEWVAAAASQAEESAGSDSDGPAELEDPARPQPGAWLPARPRQSAVERCVGRGLIKCPGRAAEKARLCYGGDVSRVVDVCRARVAVGGPAGAARFLEAAARGARIVRVKNGMVDSGGSPTRCRYRVSVPRRASAPPRGRALMVTEDSPSHPPSRVSSRHPSPSASNEIPAHLPPPLPFPTCLSSRPHLQYPPLHQYNNRGRG